MTDELDAIHHKRCERRCVLCGAVLSQYNKNTVCARHSDEEIFEQEKKAGKIFASGRAKKTKRGPKEVPMDSPESFKATQIVNATGIIFSVDPHGMRSGLTGVDAMLARQVAAYLIREDVGTSLPWIGRFLGRDHATVLHSCKKIKAAVCSGDPPREKIQAIRKLYPDMPGDDLRSLPPSLQKMQTSASLVLTSVASLFSIKPEQLLKKRRLHRIVFPRQIAAYLLRETFGQSLPEIARFLGQNHTTIMHSCKRVKSAMEREPAVRSIIENARRLLDEDKAE